MKFGILNWRISQTSKESKGSYYFKCFGVAVLKSCSLVFVVAVGVILFCEIQAFAADPPPPSSTSAVGDSVLNPVTGVSTIVSALVVDPAGTPTVGATAFVQTEDGYTFLVKTNGEYFYNNDNPPIAFKITAVSGTDATISTEGNNGSQSVISIQMTTVEYDTSVNSSGTVGDLTPPVNNSGPDGVEQVVYGRDGDDGRDGALFVSPRSGGNGKTGPTQSKTLNSDVDATSNVGWEIGSVGGDGGNGGDSYASFWSGKDGGDGGHGGTVVATQSSGSTITTSGADNHGIFAYSRSGKAGNGGSGFAAPGGGTGGHSADGGTVTVNQNGTIYTRGDGAYGIYALSVSNNGGNGGDQWGLVGESGNGGYGGSGSSVIVNSTGNILTEGEFSHGILAQSIGGSGGSSGTSGNLLVSLLGQPDNGGNGGTVEVNNSGTIQTNGDYASGIMAQSIGGGGGSGGVAGALVAVGGAGSNGGSGDEVTVNNLASGTIITKGIGSSGIIAQSIGGSGGQGSDAYGLVGIGGAGSKAGNGNTVTVSNFGSISTSGDGAKGVLAQSIGGGGGDGGNSAGMVAVGGSGDGGGYGSKVTVTNDGVITTTGDDAAAILAQSVGGGGGNGGSSGSVGAFVGVAVGGSGGAGGEGGDVEVTLSNSDATQPSSIHTSGDRSAGVFAQSVGGGGGNGGGAVQVAVGAFGAASVSVGGSGGTGGKGGDVSLSGSGAASVQTDGDDSAGILLQSVGGGGGNGGYAVSVAASGGPISGSLSVGIGGSGGNGGAGGSVTVGEIDASGTPVTAGFSGSLLTTGERSAGMLFQSVGGGGGNGGLAVSASGSGSVLFSGSVSIGVGGSGGDGGDGGRVRVYTDASVNTTGGYSPALLAQSVGGGGGNGGGTVSAGISASGGGSGTINVGVGGGAGDASIGGDVDLIAKGEHIRTKGDYSGAVIAQSIGGGGGNGGYSVAAGLAGAGAGAGAVTVGLGGEAGGGGNGGAVKAQVGADVTTEGEHSSGVLIQSVGGGGGNGGFSVSAGAAVAGTGSGAVSVGLGGSGGSGGAGGTVDATVAGDVTTKKSNSGAVVVQSIGGGGGNGGFNVSGNIAGAGVGSGSVTVGLGGTGGSGGSSDDVTAKVTGVVTTESDDSVGVLAQSVGGGGGNGGFYVSGTIAGSGTGSGAIAVGLGGSGGTGSSSGSVDLTTDKSVTTLGDRSSGVVAQSVGGGGGNGGFNVSGAISGAGTGSGSISVGLGGNGAGGGDAGTVTAVSNGQILTSGFASSGFVAQSIGGGGGNGGFNVSAALSGAGTASGAVSVGLGGSGAGGGDGKAVNAKTTAYVQTTGDASTGILAQSVGGGGGNGGFNISPALSGAGTGSGAVGVGIGGSGAGGGNGAKVTLNIANNVLTTGSQSGAVVAQSIGGGGGNGGINVTPSGSGAGTGSGAIGVGIGGRGAGGGNGSEVETTVIGNLETRGDDSVGLLAQSVGGGGGNGGLNVSAAVSAAGTGSGGAAIGLGGSAGAGGTSGIVKSQLTGNVLTAGRNSAGVVVQSLGGGGGNGGLNVSATVSGAQTGSAGVSVGLGGSGGDGGDGNIVESTVTGNVTTTGANSGGVIVQSAGGGGGNGGINVSAAVSLSGNSGGAVSVGIGGSGGGGGSGKKATGTVIGDVNTTGDDSSAIVVQSLGGGGGNGGLNVSGAVSLASSNSAAIGVGVGGGGGDGGNGDEVVADVEGDVQTKGDNSAGVIAQSVGGGGGNGGINVTGTLSLSGKGSGAAAIGVGGFGGNGGTASTVNNTFAGTVFTEGAYSGGIIAQSLGGGGGNGATNVSGTISLAPDFSGALGIGVGGFGGGGGSAGSLTNVSSGYVQTLGNNSIGVLTQSLGGGGGNGGTNISSALSLSRSTSGAIGIGVGGFGGSGADAGDSTTSSFTGGVVTTGDNSAAIVTQSLGGGGGNGGTSINAALNLTQESGGAIGLGVGGFAGGGGDGKAVSSTVRTTDDYNLIGTSGDESIGILAQSLGGGGGNGGLNVSGAVSLSGKSGAAIGLGVGGFGGDGGNAGAVELDVIGDVVTEGDKSHGVMAQSLGGGGGNGGTNVSGSLALTKPSGSDTILSLSMGVGGFGGGGGDAGSVDLDYSGNITALPRTLQSDGSYIINEKAGAHGLVAQSIGGGGGNGGTSVSAGLAISGKPGAGLADSSKSYAVLVGVGGFGGTGGDASAVNVDVSGDSTIIAHGTGRSGILAQSVGGGGGNGGLNVSGGIVSDSSLIVGVGGMGGNAGKAGNVTTNVTANIIVTTDPDDLKEPEDAEFESKLRGVLGDDIVDATEGILEATTLKDLFVDAGLFDEEADETEGSAGLLAQSIGGGGGNGGLNVSGGVALSKDGKVPSITFGIGGFGGAANAAGDVTVDHGGTIQVEGNWKHGIFAQSVGGGGGNGGMNVSGQLNWGDSETSDGATDVSVVAGLGGHGGEGADAGDVMVTSSGNISTQGYHARGVFAQSIGGGGGTGGMNITVVGTKNSSPLGVGVGGFGSGGGHAGNVTVARGIKDQPAGTIHTDGVGAHGIEAASIGGGGGDAGVNAVLGISYTTGSKSDSGNSSERKTPTNSGVDDGVIANYNAVLDELEGRSAAQDPNSQSNGFAAVVAIGGAGGNAGNGGAVDIDHYGNVVTLQDDSHGVFGQSIGGGGGNASFNIGLMYQFGQADKNKGLALSVGGGTGEGGTGGTVNLLNVGDVSTSGDNSFGVFAQSIGGGGGNAGYDNVSTDGDGGSLTVSIGRTGGTGGSGDDVFLSSDGTVLTSGDGSYGLLAQSVGNGGGNSSSTSVQLGTPKSEDDKGSKLSLNVGLEGGDGGAAGNVELEAKGFVKTIGTDAHAVFAQSVGGGGGNGGGTGGSAGSGKSYSISIGGTGGTGGTGGNVDVTNTAQVETEGDRSVGILAQSVGGSGGTGGYVKSGTKALDIAKNTVKGSKVGSTASVNIGGTGGDGMYSGTVTVDNDGIIITEGTDSHGILAQSIGGGGGMGGLIENNIINLKAITGSQTSISLGGDGGTGGYSSDVTVTNSGGIGTTEERSVGIFAQSVGGGGGDAQHVANIVLGPTADDSSNNALMIGGNGGDAGTGGNVSVTNEADGQIVTLSNYSHGILAQSIGGGGGTGGSTTSISSGIANGESKSARKLQMGLGGSGGTGGIGGDVFVDNAGSITTYGYKAHGIVAQSVGGGGGMGGSSISGDLSLKASTNDTTSVGLNIGGSGGDGNTAGFVRVDNTGAILVDGDNSYGIYAQSVGGGGGDGGMAISLSKNVLTNPRSNLAKSLSNIAIGGFGGDGANGGDVLVNHSGSIISNGNNAYGIFAQSVGGAGGNAGFSISAPVWTATDYVFSSVLGAKEGTAGKAGTVTVNTTGDIVMNGANSQAVLTQSVNGGGGNTETFLDFSEKAVQLGDGGIELPPNDGVAENVKAIIKGTLGLGGNLISDATGSVVEQTHIGSLYTSAEQSIASLTQSVGGGGGNSTTNVVVNDIADVDLTAVLGGVNTDNSAGGDVTSERDGDVATFGYVSGGGSTQSIGGGGGRLVMNVTTVETEDPETLGTKNATVVLGADPSFFNDGGDINLDLAGKIYTEGDYSSAQVVQTIGAGGGESYLLGFDTSIVTLGALDGSTGDGGAINLTNTGGVVVIDETEVVVSAITEGRRSHGFVLQSIGGGGGLVTTDLDQADVTLKLSEANGGDGGAISFTNTGYIQTSGDGSFGILAQSLGGGGGVVDDWFLGSAGGTGSGGAIDLDLTGNIVTTGENSSAVFAQSDGGSGAGDVSVKLDGVIVGGSGSAERTAAVRIDGGAANSLSVSEESFVFGLNNQAILGGDGNEEASLQGQAYGNVDFGGGVNNLTVGDKGALYALDTILLGDKGLLTIDGYLQLGGQLLTSDDLDVSKLSADQLSVTQNVGQTTTLTGSVGFGSSATYVADVHFQTNGAAGGNSDLMLASTDATMGGTLVPVLHDYQRALPLVLIDADGATADNGTMIQDTVVIDYSIGLNGSTGDGSTIDLIATPDFSISGMTRNQTEVGDYINNVLSGSGSSSLGHLFALVGNMQDRKQVIDTLDRLTSEGYAANRVEAFNAGRSFVDVMMDCEKHTARQYDIDSRSCFWASIAGDNFKRRATSQSKRLKTNSLQVFGGLQSLVTEDLYIGMAVGYQSINLTNGSRFSSDGGRGHWGISLTKHQGPWEFHGALSGSIAQYSSERVIGINGVLPENTVVSIGVASLDQWVAQGNLRLGVGYLYEVPESALYIRPSFDIDAMFINSSEDSEQQSEGYGLTLNSTNQWIASFAPSIEIGADFNVVEDYSLRTFVRGKAEFTTSDNLHINTSFTGASASDGNFQNYSEIDNALGQISSGLTLSANDNSRHLNLSYEGAFGKNTQEHAVRANVGFRF